MYFNIEIGILHKYIVECEVQWLVFIIQSIVHLMYKFNV